jgi:hypothetical protein
MNAFDHNDGKIKLEYDNTKAYVPDSLAETAIRVDKRLSIAVCHKTHEILKRDQILEHCPKIAITVRRVLNLASNQPSIETNSSKASLKSLLCLPSMKPPLTSLLILLSIFRLESTA